MPLSRIQHENRQQIEENVEEAGDILDDEFDETDDEYNLVAGRKLEGRVKRNIQKGETAFENIKQSMQPTREYIEGETGDRDMLR